MSAAYWIVRHRVSGEVAVATSSKRGRFGWHRTILHRSGGFRIVRADEFRQDWVKLGRMSEGEES
jgi:hypothetical protein